MLKIVFSNKFKKDYKRIRKQGKDISKLEGVLQKLTNCEELPRKMYDHKLTGEYSGFRECHIEPDWLLIYRIESGELMLLASETGSHSYLFGL